MTAPGLAGRVGSVNRGAELLAAFRKDGGLTQMQMAVKLECHPQEVYAYETGRKKPGRKNAVKLRDVAEVPVDAWDKPSPTSPEEQK